MVHSKEEIARIEGRKIHNADDEFSHIQAEYSKDVIKKYVKPKLCCYGERKVLPNESFDADIVFDCTGLNRLLMREQKFVGYDLPCTMATAGRVTPIVEDPWTTTRAMEAGAIASGMLAVKELLDYGSDFHTAHIHQSEILDELAYNTGLHYKLCNRQEPFWQSLDRTIDQDVLDWHLNNDNEYGFFPIGSYKLLLESHNGGSPMVQKRTL